MKFWKILRKLLDEIFPDWQDKFISYKDLKKQLNSISPQSIPPEDDVVDDDDERSKKRPRLGDDRVDVEGKEVTKEMADFVMLPPEDDVVDDDDERSKKRPRLGDDRVDVEGKEVTKEMADFVMLLEGEIKKFNGFFMDKEEEYIITFKMLKDEVAEAKDSKEELMKVGRKLVDFHGEMILLENYSALNYTGLLKILKKYDKKSGDLIRLPFIQKVLHEPFFRTEVINKLVKECETMIVRIFQRHEQLAPPDDGDQREGCSDQPAVEEEAGELRVPEELAEIKCMENMYLKLTISALRTLKDIRGGSSTVSMFSLPPMHDAELEESRSRRVILEFEPDVKK